MNRNSVEIVQAWRPVRCFAQAEGNAERAWDDLLACHRLARLMGQRPFPVDRLIALTLDIVAWDADLGLLEKGRPTADQVSTDAQ